jgi:hypothetical protein
MKAHRLWLASPILATLALGAVAHAAQQWSLYPGNGCVLGIANGYVLGCSVDSNGNSPIFQVTPTGYQQVAGAAKRIYWGDNGSPWALTSNGQLWWSQTATNPNWMPFANTGNGPGQMCVKGGAFGATALWILTCDDTVRYWLGDNNWSDPILGWNATTPDPWGIGDIALYWADNGCRGREPYVITGHGTLYFVEQPSGPQADCSSYFSWEYTGGTARAVANDVFLVDNTFYELHPASMTPTAIAAVPFGVTVQRPLFSLENGFNSIGPDSLFYSNAGVQNGVYVASVPSP